MSAEAPVKVTLLDVLRALHSGKRVVMDRSHGESHECPVCGGDCMRAPIVDLAQTHEVCTCGNPTYDHLVEQLWHRSCFKAQGSALEQMRTAVLAVADELDAIDGSALASLGGVSLGGAVRHALIDADGETP